MPVAAVESYLGLIAVQDDFAALVLSLVGVDGFDNRLVGLAGPCLAGVAVVDSLPDRIAGVDDSDSHLAGPADLVDPCLAEAGAVGSRLDLFAVAVGFESRLVESADLVDPCLAGADAADCPLGHIAAEDGFVAVQSIVADVEEQYWVAPKWATESWMDSSD